MNSPYSTAGCVASVDRDRVLLKGIWSVCLMAYLTYLGARRRLNQLSSNQTTIEPRQHKLTKASPVKDDQG